MLEDTAEKAPVSAIEPAPPGCRRLGAGQVVDTLESQRFGFRGAEPAVRPAGLEESTRHVEQVEVAQAFEKQLAPGEPRSSLEQGDVERLAVEGDPALTCAQASR